MINIRTQTSNHPKFKSNNKYNFSDLLVMANAIFREIGYIKSNDFSPVTSEEEVTRLPNVMIARHLLKAGKKLSPNYVEFIDGLNIDTKDEDSELSVNQIKFFKGLIIKGMKGNLSDFEQKILKLIKDEYISYPDIGVVVSLPLIYKNALKFKETENLEKSLAKDSDFIGEEYSRNEFTDVNILLKKFIHRTNSWLYVGTVNGTNILKFFSQIDLETGSTINCKGYVKEHRVNVKTKAKETIINRVSILS